MKRWLIVLSCLALFALSTREAQAQRKQNRKRPPGRAAAAAHLTRPAVSPYLNLQRNDPTGTNYQTLVRPFVQQRATNVQSAQAIDDLDQAVNTLANPPVSQQPTGIRSTGARSGFRNLSHYYSRRTGAPRGG